LTGVPVLVSSFQWQPAWQPAGTSRAPCEHDANLVLAPRAPQRGVKRHPIQSATSTVVAPPGFVAPNDTGSHLARATVVQRSLNER
jgi:hypothetical protein